MARISSWGKWHCAVSPENTSGGRSETPKSRKQLKSLMGSMHSLHKFFPKLAEVSAPLRPLLSQNNDFVCTPNCENSFQQLKSLVKNIVELRHFDIHREMRIIYDASHDGLGAVLD